jgi:hypothetical protein
VHIVTGPRTLVSDLEDHQLCAHAGHFTSLASPETTHQRRRDASGASAKGEEPDNGWPI